MRSYIFKESISIKRFDNWTENNNLLVANTMAYLSMQCRSRSQLKPAQEAGLVQFLEEFFMWNDS